MPRPRGTSPDTVRLDLSDGDWIQVKKELTAGEAKSITFDSFRGYTDRGSRMDIDGRKLAFMAAAVYITGWSFVGLNGQGLHWPANASVDERIKALAALDEPTFAEIETALTAHRQVTQETEEKNSTRTGSGIAASS